MHPFRLSRCTCRRLNRGVTSGSADAADPKNGPIKQGQPKQALHGVEVRGYIRKGVQGGDVCISCSLKAAVTDQFQHPMVGLLIVRPVRGTQCHRHRAVALRDVCERVANKPWRLPWRGRRRLQRSTGCNPVPAVCAQPCTVLLLMQQTCQVPPCLADGLKPMSNIMCAFHSPGIVRASSRQGQLQVKLNGRKLTVV